jgi:predicted DsbA family dithiol-disulfide isomerase
MTPSTPDRHEHDTPTEAVVPRVLIFYDYACPFCYVDQFRFERLRDEYAAELVLVPFELRPSAPPGGLSALAEGLTHSERVEKRLLEHAEEAGKPMVLPDLVPNTHLAMVMAEFARDIDPTTHWRVHMAVFDAYYGQGRDIGDSEVLLGVARECGLDEGALKQAWDDGRYEQRLHEYDHVAQHLGIDTTPAALICNELLIGSRPYGVLRDALDRCMIRPGNVVSEEADG